MEAEQERLVRLYRELGDDHLKDLADEPESLTDAARFALLHELQRRGLSAEPTVDGAAEVSTAATERESGFGAGIPGIFPSGAAIVEQALEPGGDERNGYTGLIVFYDGLELSRACDALNDSEVDFAIEEKGGDALVGAPPAYEVWVASVDLDLAQRVLREKAGLFPLPELDEEPQESGARLLGTFETRPEADEAMQVLQGAALHPTLTEPLDDTGWWTIEVPAAELDRGLQTVSQRLRLEP